MEEKRFKINQNVHLSATCSKQLMSRYYIANYGYDFWCNLNRNQVILEELFFLDWLVRVSSIHEDLG